MKVTFSVNLQDRGIFMKMSKYLAITSGTIQTDLAYRSTYLITILTNFIHFLLLVYLWQAIYTGENNLQGYSWEQIKIYLIIAFIVNSDVFTEYRFSWKMLDGSI